MSDSQPLSDAQRAESRRLVARSRKRAAQREQDLLSGLWRFPVLHRTDFDKDGAGTWFYHDAEAGHAEETTVVLSLGDQVHVFRCVGDGQSGLLRWLSVQVCDRVQS